MLSRYHPAAAALEGGTGAGSSGSSGAMRCVYFHGAVAEQEPHRERESESKSGRAELINEQGHEEAMGGFR